MAFYKRKPKVIQAVKWDNTEETLQKLKKLDTNNNQLWEITGGKTLVLTGQKRKKEYAFLGYWVLRSPSGELSAMSPADFAKEYEQITN